MHSPSLQLDPSLLNPSSLAGLLLGGTVLIAGLMMDLLLLDRLVRRPPDWRAVVSRLRDRPWHADEAGFILATLVAIQLAIMIVMPVAFRLLRLSTGAQTALAVVIQSVFLHGTGIFLVLRILRLRGIAIRDAFGLREHGVWRSVRDGLALYLAAMPLVAVTALAYAFGLDAVGYPAEPQTAIQMLMDPAGSPLLQAHLITMAIIVAPIAEEVLFRGIALPVLLKHARPAAAVVAVSLAFALIHFHVPSVAPLFVIAAVFSLGYLVSGSLLVPMVMHVCFNAVTLAIVVLLRDLPFELAILRLLP